MSPAGHSGERLPLLRRQPPPWAQLSVVSIAVGCRHAHDPRQWRGALVVLEHGELHLECLSGNHWRFREGAVMFLAGLPIRALWNVGAETATLCVLSRCADSDL